MVFQPGQSGCPGGGGPRPKLWRDAITRAIKRREESDPLALERLADKLIALASTGDMAAIKELGDRMDGKPAQAIVGGDVPLKTQLEVSWTFPDSA